MFLSLLSIIALSQYVVHATNDWSTPCLAGQCSYDVNNGTANGTLTLTGPTNAISDITPAAGWTILDCNSNAADQDIRLVCTGSEQDCNHLFQGDAVGTIVRLPEDCGHMPFARVASEWVHANQTVPGRVAVQLRRRNTPNPTVRGLTLDTNWAAANPSPGRTVSFRIEGANTATTPDTTGIVHVDRRDINHPSTSISKTFSFGLDEPITLLDQSISCPATGNLPAINEHARLGVEAIADGQIGYGFSASGTIIPPSVDTFEIFAALDFIMNGILTLDATAGATLDTGRQRIVSLSLTGLSFSSFFTIVPSFFVDVSGAGQMAAVVNMDVNLGYSLSGARISFPSSSDSSVGNIGPTQSNLQLSAGASGAADAELIAHVIPGVQFGISAFSSVSATVNMNVDAFGQLEMSLVGLASAGIGGGSSTGVNPHASSVFPTVPGSTFSGFSSPAFTNSGGLFTPSPSPARNASTISVVGTVPTVSPSPPGVRVGGSSSSEGFFQSTFSPSHTAGISTFSPSPSSRTSLSSAHPSNNTVLTVVTRAIETFTSAHLGTVTIFETITIAEPTSSIGPNTLTGRDVAAPTPLPLTSRSTSSSFSGCVDISSGLTVSAGASGSFFGLFDGSTSVTLFSKTFDLFNTCFGNGPAKRSLDSTSYTDVERRQSRDMAKRGAGLTCISNLSGALAGIVNKIIPFSPE